MPPTASETQTRPAAAKEASRKLARLSSEVKNQALRNVARGLLTHEASILAANDREIEAGRRAGLPEAILDRLLLTHERLEGIAGDVHQVSLLPDPVGEVFEMRTLPNGLQAGRKRVPLGVIAVVYESRPNVTVDIASLCLKSGNACVLRGGKEAIDSNIVLAGVVREAIAEAGVPPDAVQMVENTDRALLGELLKMRDTVDLIVPRGGEELIRYVVENATMPVLTGGTGVCHTYVDRAAEIAEEFLPAMARSWTEAGVEMRCDERSLRVLKAQEIPEIKLAQANPDDFGREFLALTAAVKTVDSLDGALEHIQRYGTGHSDAIITEDYSAAMRFLDEVDSAVVYVNASTQFTDGAQFGLGAEIIDSTQKTIARGPVGLREITTYKWIIFGNGQTRPK